MPGISDRLSHLFRPSERQRNADVSRDVPISPGGGGILDAYEHEAPSGEAAIRIFQGEWSSELPPPYDEITGSSELFQDARIEWLLEVLGGVRGFQVLELGPLEAGHTFMLEQAGADDIIAIEANVRAFLKCLIVKELLGLRRSRFLCGDLQKYLAECTDTYDLCLASGVLYHLRQPVEVLKDMARVSDRLFLWTHYYDPVALDRPEVAVHFASQNARAVDDFEFTEHRYEYKDALAWNGFCGGSASYANWLERDAILECLRRAGFRSIEIGFDDPMTRHGPAFALVAQRS